MFPLHQNNELLLRFSSHNGQRPGSPPYLAVGHAPLNSDTTTAAAGSVAGIPEMIPKESSPKLDGYLDKLLANNEGGDDPVDRKRRHREVERQRRKEMTCLYSDLRSKLPQELRKLSISDLMNEASNYISQMQSKVRDLNLRRDELKRIRDSGSRNYCSKNDTNVDVRPWDDGLQVVISRERGLLASKALKVLSELEGLNIVSCIQSIANGRMLLTIHCKAHSTISNFDIPQIKRYLKEAVDRQGCRLCTDFNLGVDISAS